MRHAGHVVTRTMLLEGVWDYHFDPQTNVIRCAYRRLRQKIDRGFDKPLIHTVRGAGFADSSRHSVQALRSLRARRRAGARLPLSRAIGCSRHRSWPSSPLSVQAGPSAADKRDGARRSSAAGIRRAASTPSPPPGSARLKAAIESRKREPGYFLLPALPTRSVSRSPAISTSSRRRGGAAAPGSFVADHLPGHRSSDFSRGRHSSCSTFCQAASAC